MRITRIGRTYKNFKRLREIINVFVKYGFEYLINKLNLRRHASINRRVFSRKHEEKYILEEKVRFVFEELGPTFIKFGQILSLRADILPVKLIQELSKLQDEVKPFPFLHAKELIEAELKQPIEKIFSDVDEKPLASASMAQVHCATLRGTREKVIIKVQRPDIEKEINRDIDIMFYLAHLLEKYVPESRAFNPTGIVEEFSRAIIKELDFTYEISNADRFRDIFKDSKTVYIPKVYFKYSGKRVLVMEYIEGMKITSYERIKGIDKAKLADNLIGAYYTMIFEHGFFHADPHPGNLLIMKDEVIGFVDFGMAGRLDDDTIKRLAYLYLSIARKDFNYDVEKYEALGILEEYEDNPEFQQEAILLMERYKGFPLERIDIGAAVNELSEMARRYGVKFPKELVLLGKTMFVTERLTRELVPEFNFIEKGKPFATEFLSQQFKPKQLVKSVEKSIFSLYSFLRTFPAEMTEIFKRIKKGTLKIEFEHVGLEPLINEIDRASNRLTFGFIIGALIVGSSLIIKAGAGPKIFDQSVYGLLGYMIAAILGLGLAVSILRSGKL